MGSKSGSVEAGLGARGLPLNQIPPTPCSRQPCAPYLFCTRRPFVQFMQFMVPHAIRIRLSALPSLLAQMLNGGSQRSTGHANDA